MESQIGRTSTEAEKRDMKIVGYKTPQQFFSLKLANKEQEFAKNHKPFDAACARLDFKDEIKRTETESERVFGYVREEDALKVDITNLDKYGNEDRFEVVSADEEVESRLIDNIRTQAKVGWTVKYRCKQRGHGISIFMPTDVYEKKFLKKSKKEE